MASVDHVEVDVQGPIVDVPQCVNASNETLDASRIQPLSEKEPKKPFYEDLSAHTIIDAEPPKPETPWQILLSKLHPNVPPPYPPCPTPTRASSSFFGRWLYTYMTPLMQRGLYRTLVPEDYPPIELRDESMMLSNKLMEEWDKELSTKGKEHAKLWKATFRAFGWQFLACGFLYLCEVLASVRIGVHLRTAFIVTIYRKCLSLSLSHTSSTGYILNLISNDVQRFEDAAPFAHYIWVGPVHLFLVMYFVYNNLGAAGFASIGVLMAFIPMQAWFASIFRGLRILTSRWRDERIKSGSDMLAGVMVVKLYAWEQPFIKKIGGLRDVELKYIRKASVLRATNEALYFASNALVNIAGFMVYHFTGGVFTPAKVFTTLTFISQCRLSMANFFPRALQFCSEAHVSFQRVQEFLSLQSMSTTRDHQKETQTCDKYGPDAMVVVEKGNFSWEMEGRTEEGKVTPPRKILKDVDLVVRRGQLCCIVGPVGSGKSSLLNAILGEMVHQSGSVSLRSAKVAYASQSPWIIQGTVKDNILFSNPYDEKRFWWTIKVCALERDVQLFEDGVETLIGERGVTLSGGQRARLALARAVYFDADVYVLDDPLSAVDTKVGRHLFEKCLRDALKDKAVILVTHQLQYVRECENVVLMEGGKVTRQGRYEDVMQAEGSAFAKTMAEFAARPAGVDVEVDNVDAEQEGVTKVEQKVQAAVPGDREGFEAVSERKTDSAEPREAKKELSTEEAAQGTVPFSTYWSYFSSGAPVFVLILLAVALVLGEGSRVTTDYWLSRWSSRSPAEQMETKYPLAFGLLVLTTVFLSLSRAIGFFLVCWIASRTIFTKMVSAIFASPMDFFQRTPHGRLMNRFSKDMNNVDELLPQTFFDFTQCFFMVVGTLTVAVVIIPYVLVLVPIVFCVFLYLRRYYLAGGRQIKRFEGITRSPVYSTVPATLEGLATVRAFGAQDRFTDTFIHLQNENTRVYFMFQGAAKWLGIRVDLMSATFLFVVTFFAVGMRYTLGLSGGTMGLLLSYMLQLIGLLQWCIRQSAEVENQMICVERVLEYTKLESEAPAITLVRPPENWPTYGEVQIKNMSLAYPTNPRPVLRNINVSIPPGTKVGIVGRTGAGKSSFLQALFRIVEPTPANSIIIDSISTTTLGLTDLRSKMSIIPQEPFCFKGSLRFNIDPFEKSDDATIWRVLEAVELKRVVENLPGKLDAEVAENGSNWSVGERQLICLARAILKKTKVIVMDEATSAVDLRTDAVIQEGIRNREKGMFGDATVLTIAHRLNTVIDYDLVMVLDDGQVVELGTPYELLEKPVSQESAWFARMVGEMGTEAQELLRGMAWDMEVKRRHAANLKTE
ncbi:Multidrug resistance-associated protein 4 [Rhizophlyctis rosea]|uniref:Multidrug resistance-associated protein 4 n=1 Tax=Rhizophlyctis rosea TaxID=64517 RepID=A0AAD5SIF3_9FUNG|nr:Multidrug resistance-associated protein 4 [Rhizophlyctis rosea]